MENVEEGRGIGLGRAIDRYVITYAIALAPVLLYALTWSPSGNWTVLKALLRNYSAPVIGSEIFVIVVAVREGLLRSIRSWQWSRPIIPAGTILLSIAIATAATAPLRLDAMILTSFWFIHAIFAVSLCYLCGRVFEVGDLVRAYMVAFMLIAVQLVTFVLAVPDWPTFDWRGGILAFNHLRHIGYYVAALAGIAFGVMAIARTRAQWLWALATAATAIGIALWTGSRGAVLALAAAVVVGLLFAPATRRFRGWGGALASAVIAIAVASQVPVPPDPNMGFARTVAASSGDNNGDVTTGRTVIWQGAVRAIQDRPLFGYGEGQMRKVAPYSRMVQPHQSLLQVTLAWGLVGLLCVLTFAIAFAVRALPAVREDDRLAPPFLAMTAIGILSLYDGALYNALPISIFLACGALIASRWRPQTAPARVASPATSS